MAFGKCDFVLAITVFALLSAATPTWAAPTRSSSRTGTDSTGSGSGSGSESGENCNAELTSSEIQSLRTQINDATSSLSGTIQRVHVWPSNGIRAAVGIYDESNRIISDGMVHSDYGHALAASVGRLYTFVRPVGDVLTNETVREVIDMEEGFAEDFSDVLTKVGEVATKLYDLVKGVWTIHECILPNLPSNTYTSLNPQPPSGVENATDRDMIVDGIAAELALLTDDIQDAMNNYYAE